MAHRFPMEELDTASYSLKCGVELLGALHTAIEEGPFGRKLYGCDTRGVDSFEWPFQRDFWLY